MGFLTPVNIFLRREEMTKLREIVRAQNAIQQLRASRDIDGDIAYKMSRLSRKIKPVMEDVGAFEQSIIKEIGLQTQGPQLMFPGQDLAKLNIYLKRREDFLTSEEVEIEIPSYKYSQLKPAKLSSDDIDALEALGLLIDEDPPEEPEEEDEEECEETEATPEPEHEIVEKADKE
jgi:hypothetical protein